MAWPVIAVILVTNRDDWTIKEDPPNRKRWNFNYWSFQVLKGSQQTPIDNTQCLGSKGGVSATSNSKRKRGITCCRIGVNHVYNDGVWKPINGRVGGTLLASLRFFWQD